MQTRWSWRVAEIAGIPIRIHVTLALLLGWIALSYSRTGIGPAATAFGVLLVLAVFVVIAVHELAHALVARRFGVPTREILLLPIGGIASIEHMPERPGQELAIAIVGPLVNLALAGILWLAPGDFAWQLARINLGLALFNLIPAFPMDGGRALRAVLALWLRRDRATEIAGRLGMIVAIGFAALGFVTNPWLIVIAAVVWLGARQEVEMVRTTSAIAGVPVRAAMTLRSVEPVAPETPLERAAATLLATGQTELPIVDHGTTVGVLTRGDVARGLADAGADATVAGAPHHDAIVAAPDEPLVHAVDRLRDAPNAVIVVEDRGRVVGLVTPERLATFAAGHAR